MALCRGVARPWAAARAEGCSHSTRSLTRIGGFPAQELAEENAKLREENEKLKASSGAEGEAPPDRPADPTTVHRTLRLINLANAVLLGFAGIWNMLTAAFQPLVWIFGFYVIIFSCIFGCFEIRCAGGICASFFYRNMGFMFGWKGRLLFLLFVCSLVIGQGLVGSIVGFVTLTNCLLNVAVMCKYPDYFKMLRTESEELARDAMQRELRSVIGNAAKEYMMSEMKSGVAAMMGMDEVEKMVDENDAELGADTIGDEPGEGGALFGSAGGGSLFGSGSGGGGGLFTGGGSKPAYGIADADDHEALAYGGTSL